MCKYCIVTWKVCVNVCRDVYLVGISVVNDEQLI